MRGESEESALLASRRALAGREAWLVGGLVRDRELGRASRDVDVDVVVAGDPADAARAIARAAGRAACFELSSEFASWRVVAHGRGWQVDVEPLRAATIEQDLALRDFTVNAIAEPLSGGTPIDPLGGLEDLRERRLRMAGRGAFAADPARVLRLVRVGVELGLEPDRETFESARAAAPALRAVSPERVLMELRRIIAAPQASSAVATLSALGATAAVLPELEALRAVDQSRFHHADVFDHTLEVLDWTVAIGQELGSERSEGPELSEGTESSGAHPQLERAFAARRGELAAFLNEPLADELTRGDALRWGALLHDCAKPLTRAVTAGGRVTFFGHDERGAELARAVLTRLRASERLRAHVSALVRHHLRLGFLVHEPQPLDRRAVFAYLRECAPVEVDVTLLSIADRLATRGEDSERAIEAHLRLAGAMLPDALRWRTLGPPRAPLRGDELARELGIARGPHLGRLLEELSKARYAGELQTREEAITYARSLL